jgi:hypothetical protein
MKIKAVQGTTHMVENPTQDHAGRKGAEALTEAGMCI